ncbi:MAG: hypothetical protein EOO69_13925 [Moraxellaceae bacterium]|nr:MAG: hypothetical protein EOO69_13925 [Moraxellaceae bacterium]
MAIPDISIETECVRTVPFSGALRRVMSRDYQKVERTGDDTDVSPEFDQYSWSSVVSGVEIDEEVRLRLLEREDSKALFRQKAEKCHIISKKNKTYEHNPNNIIYCSRNLHQQYDAIDSTAGVEQFYLQYVGHDPNPSQGIVNKKQCSVYATSVRVIFIDEQAKNTLHSDFKLHTDIDKTTIQLELHFQDPLTFDYCTKTRAEQTCARWRSYEGIND